MQPGLPLLPSQQPKQNSKYPYQLEKKRLQKQWHQARTDEKKIKLNNATNWKTWWTKNKTNTSKIIWKVSHLQKPQITHFDGQREDSGDHRNRILQLKRITTLGLSRNVFKPFSKEIHSEEEKKITDFTWDKVPNGLASLQIVRHPVAKK